MATLHLSKSTTVEELRKEFNENFGSQVKLYKGRGSADGSMTLSELGITNEGTFECRSSLTVASFIERMMDEFGLKVKVYTCDEWVACLDGLTLESTGKVKKNAVKSDMEDMIAYQKSAVVSANDSAAPEVDDEDDDDDAEDPIGECIVNNVSYDIFSNCAFAQYLDDDDATSVTIPDYVEFEGKSYPVTYWGAGSESVTVVELGKNVKYVDALHADCENLKKIIVHSPKGFIEAEDLENAGISLEKCYPGVEICYDSNSSSNQDCKSSIVIDRNYWVNQSTEENVGLIENALEMLNAATQNHYELKYNKAYIGITKEGKPTVFATFVPQRGDLLLEIKVGKTAAFDKILVDKFDGQGGYKDGWYSIHIQTEDTEKKGGFFKKLLGKTASNLESLKAIYAQAEKEFFAK